MSTEKCMAFCKCHEHNSNTDHFALGFQSRKLGKISCQGLGNGVRMETTLPCRLCLVRCVGNLDTKKGISLTLGNWDFNLCVVISLLCIGVNLGKNVSAKGNFAAKTNLQLVQPSFANRHLMKTSYGQISTPKCIVSCPYHVYIIPITTLSAGRNIGRRSSGW